MLPDEAALLRAELAKVAIADVVAEITTPNEEDLPMRPCLLAIEKRGNRASS
ncbi:hypothetical protein [Rhizobium sp. S163]|uniref:hypothetical protein n=1 Tax=Rhizobium sp. S163 TaxID=3055039 RepID=UPI0025AA221D|nr:hypothetical protein [Rhizobium sp. S163]MDM9646710.1 hypothetical protein [Rhizobium sp. S163]